MPTIILGCSCVSKFQDQRYGKGKRVHNRMTKGGKKELARCTVCGMARECSTKVQDGDSEK